MPLPAPHLLGLLLTTLVIPSLSLFAGDGPDHRDRGPGAVRAGTHPADPLWGADVGTATRAAPSTPAAVWPLRPRPTVVTAFDPPSTAYGPGHRGVDLAGSSDQPVRAAVAGRVTYAGLLAGRGVVVVSHGSTRTTYEPVRARVQLGELVDAGTILGRLQTAQSHCTPAACLHWGLIRGRTYLDPLTLVDAGPVRLLPLGPVLGTGR